MILTNRGLHLFPGEDVLYHHKVLHERMYLRAIPPQDCGLCVLYSCGGCSLVTCMPSERGDAGVHFIAERKEVVV